MPPLGEITEKPEGKDEKFEDIPLKALDGEVENGLVNSDAGIANESSNDTGMEQNNSSRFASLTKDLVNYPFVHVDWLDKLAKFHPKAFVTLAGFCSNIVTKGTMKSVGFIFKAIKEQNENISDIMAVLWPTLMHMSFNCFSPMISLVVKHCTYFWTLILGDSLISFALWLMSGISREDENQATRTLVISGLMLGIGCALTYHTGVQKLNRIVGNKKNASYNGLSLTGNSLGAIIVFWGISHLLKTSPFEGSLMIMAWCTLALSMIFTLIYLIPQRYINHHEYQLKLWRLGDWKDKVGTAFLNKADRWQSAEDWFFLNHLDDDLVIYIGNASNNKFLGVMHDGEVIQEDFAAGKQGQLWKKGSLNAEGYFTLENSEMPKFLTATPDNNLEITKNIEQSIAKEKWYESFYDKDIMKKWSYYLLIISQCANAIGYLNLTTFLNVHLAQSMKYDNWKIVTFLSIIQVCDLIGRMLLPFLSDQLKKYCWFSIHLFYMVGTLGVGACMIGLQYITTDLVLAITFVLLGLFSSCFLATWNSVIKAETENDKAFNVIYSHSLFVCGIVQFVVTLVMLESFESMKSGENYYGQLLAWFGATLMTAAVPIFILLFVGLRKKETIERSSNDVETSETIGTSETIEISDTVETSETVENIETSNNADTTESTLKPPRDPLVNG